MTNLRGIIITVLGILLLLPLLGVDQLGTATEGILAWLIGLGVLGLGIQRLTSS